MKLSVYIAKRYLFAKKSRNAINIISAVSVTGVAVGTMALIIILSVFNGLEDMVRSIFNTFDPDLKITPSLGKTFIPDSSKLEMLANVNGVACYSLTIEENALLRYDDRQTVATIKGVDDTYVRVTGIDSSMWDGEFILKSDRQRDYAIPGIGIANYLGIGITFVTPLNIYVPKLSASSTVNPEDAFNRKFIYPSGIFQVEQSYDSKYVYVPIDFARELIGNDNGVSSIEIKFTDTADEKRVKKEVSDIFGDDFVVQNRFEQQEIFYRVMKSERFAIFLILTLILIIASFNIIGSLTMLIIEKERDIEILKSLGADRDLIRRIFIFEGWMISIMGAVIGLILGFIICWLQQTYGLVRLQSDSLLLTSYPISMEFKDFIIVPLTVLTIGYWAAWYPVRYLTKKYLDKNDKKV
ncbi:MAG TPA: FtsX-like permease family protein [Bacteroidales bacterium]|jgi:lipoprotein-releasing system permease protein|nr:FtsX-like permease family protein [Bacteroidales bacterium]OQB61338.1 MAG: Lipoprotein-releasing system transmembrane protein LolE [Bacteroidetes bacterium ADurb.Bin145]NMD02438.1 ABC transporter permease [Bacteroidales bacterium]HOU01677.1 FtsX-like permease family protein [Bacteroidales bacterium]HQG62602.1 FtsX-like permease family protein [Bacteroidales bacterium]